MLRTNSKEVKARIRAYIIENFVNPEDLGYEEIKNPEQNNFKEIAGIIYKVFKLEVYYPESWRVAHNVPEQAAFKDWCSGLPSIMDTPYYYREQAAKRLGDILEQTEAERNRYTEEQAETTLTNLIYREIKAEV